MLFFIYFIEKKVIEKFDYFLDHKETLNSRVFENENIQIGLSKKTLNELETYKEHYLEPINLSNIENYKFKDLITIMDNINRTDMFIYEEENNRPVRDRKPLES